MSTNQRAKEIRARISERRFQIERARKEVNRLRKHRGKYLISGTPKRVFHNDDQLVRTIACPRVLDLRKNYDSTIALISSIRKWVHASKRSRVHIDFESIHEITPAAALLLSAEIHRWTLIRPNSRIRATTVHSWSEEVKWLFSNMGLFRLLNLDNPERVIDMEEVPSGINRVYLPFFNGQQRRPKDVLALRNQIEGLTGPIKRRRSFNDGLEEAIINVNQHAYKKSRRHYRWWISASIDRENKSLTVMCLDHGIGIANSLRTSKVQELGMFGFNRIREKMRQDHDLIRAAVEGRSSTGLTFRGKGLRKDIKRYVEAHDARGTLRIYSGKGVYEYKKSHTEEAQIECLTSTTLSGWRRLDWPVGECF